MLGHCHSEGQSEDRLGRANALASRLARPTEKRGRVVMNTGLARVAVYTRDSQRRARKAPESSSKPQTHRRRADSKGAEHYGMQ